jgi:RNA polymerase sigma-70 factor, ECF subfamily
MLDVEQLYLESRDALISYFRRRHRSSHAADDLLQETFLRLMRQVDRCFPAASPRGYLFGIARHVSADAWRRAQPQADDAVETVSPQPDARLEAARESIAGMPASQREILDLRFQHDLSYAEIAEALDIPVGTVRSRLHNAIALLREQMEKES